MSIAGNRYRAPRVLRASVFDVDVDGNDLDDDADDDDDEEEAQNGSMSKLLIPSRRRILA